METAILKTPGEKSLLQWKTILAPTDFSEPLKEAVKTAIGLAEQCGAKIILLHVAQLPASAPAEAALNVDEIVHASRESLEEMAASISAALLRDKLVRMGTQGVVEDIVAAARNLSADLIVISTHGDGRLKRALLGSTAEKEVRHAPCPVLVVRRKEDLSETNQNE
jgi:nucleotide-binding universal stress UspA family protein